MIEFSCGHCGNRLRAPEARVGAQARCPKCQRDVTIPSAGVAAAPSSPPEPVSTVEVPVKRAPLARLAKLLLSLGLIAVVLLASLWIGMAWRAGSMERAPKSVGEFWDRLMQRPANQR
jgi:hypothetical protein